jgi:hypothetical protein
MDINMLSDYLVVDYLGRYQIISSQEYAEIIWELLHIMEGTMAPDEARTKKEYNSELQIKLADILTAIVESGEVELEQVLEQMSWAASGIEDKDYSLALSDEVFEKVCEVMAPKGKEDRLWN